MEEVLITELPRGLSKEQQATFHSVLCVDICVYESYNPYLLLEKLQYKSFTLMPDFHYLKKRIIDTLSFTARRQSSITAVLLIQM